MFISNNRASFHLWRRESLLKHQRVSKYYESDCNYIGRTCRHFKTRIEEIIKKDSKSHFFKYLHSTATCFSLCNSLFLKIIDKANYKFDLKLKEALHVNWGKLNSNDCNWTRTQYHLVLKRTLK